jgi:rare lipoprotein A (peptidoglycan hydrolase)
VRQRTERPRAIFGAGAISSALLVAGTAAAQAPAPPQEPAPAAPTVVASSAPHKSDARLRVTARRLNVRAGQAVAVKGVLRPRAGRRPVTLERRVRGGWAAVDRSRTTKAGRFILRYRPQRVNTGRLRVRFAGDATTTRAKHRVGRFRTYRPAYASWYGPGLYGNSLACGGRLTTGTLGVAHKSLACGTPVTLRAGSRIVRVRVIDRGPYSGAREFDLTAATKYRLGFGSTGRVWVSH